TNSWTYQVVTSGLSPTSGVLPRLDIDSAGDLHVVYNNWGTQIKMYAKRTGPTSWAFTSLSPAPAPDVHFMRVSAGAKPRIATGYRFWDAAWDIVTPANGATWHAESMQLVSWAGTGSANVDARMNPMSAFQSLATNVAADEVSVLVPPWVTSTA